MRAKDLQKYCRLEDDAQNLLKMAISDLNFSARAYDRILKGSARSPISKNRERSKPRTSRRLSNTDRLIGNIAHNGNLQKRVQVGIRGFLSHASANVLYEAIKAITICSCRRFPSRLYPNSTHSLSAYTPSKGGLKRLFVSEPFTGFAQICTATQSQYQLPSPILPMLGRV